MRAAIFFLATIPYAAADVVDSDLIYSSQGACYDTVTHEAISSVLFNGAARSATPHPAPLGYMLSCWGNLK